MTTFKLSSPLRTTLLLVVSGLCGTSLWAQQPVADISKMPDISGKWFVYHRGQVVRNNGAVKRPLNPAQRSTDGVDEFVFQRSADASADFVEKPGDSDASMWRIKWSEPTQRFQWKWADDPTNNYEFTMMVQPDGKTTRVRITQSKKDGSTDGKRSEAEAEAVYYEEWSREKNDPHTFGYWGSATDRQESQEILVKETFDGLAFFSKPLGKWSHLRIPRPEFSLLLSHTTVSQELAGTKTDEAVYCFSSRTGRIAKLPIPNELRDPNKNWPILGPTSATVELGNEVYVITAQSGEWSSPNSPGPTTNPELQPAPERVANRSSHAIPNTPAAIQLVERLGTQESAAAAEAATIRQLQANGQAEQNQPAIAEHQRKLKNLLSTAFDLKLQSEELQVKELQSRLSRLERQIGQRKELREKIINRRAGDLLNLHLNWDTQAPSPLVTAGGTTELEGEWSLESIKGGGVVGHETGLKLRVRNHQWTVLRGEQESRYSLEVNPTTSPKSIGIIGERIEGRAPYSVKGIYVLEGDTLLITWGDNGRGQPSEFDAQESSIHTWKRIREVNEHLQSHINSPAGAAIATSDQNVIVVDLYSGSQVLPGLGKNPGYSKLVQSLNALKGVTVNFREAGNGNAIVMAIVRDPSQRCQREARQTQKESELRIAINSALKAAGIEATRWDEGAAAENAESKPADKAETQTVSSKLDPLPSPEQLREQLEPFAKRAAVAEVRVRELETIYFRDRSNMSDLQQALDELTQARRDWHVRSEEILAAFQLGSVDYSTSTVIAQGLAQQLDKMQKQLADGAVTADEVQKVADAMKRASATSVREKARYESYAKALERIMFSESDDVSLTSYSAPPAQSGYDPEIALLWLETATDLKLELVRIDDGLKLPFKAALRVRESRGVYSAGDLIVVLNGHRFESLDQAVESLKPATTNTQSDRGSLVLARGLSGRQQKRKFNHQRWDRDILEPDNRPYKANIELEVRVRGEKAEDAETKYVNGTCVSPDGLVVIPISAKSLIEGEAIVAHGAVKGTARVVASDDKRGLTLVRIISPDHKLFSWVKCRAGMPLKNQQLALNHQHFSTVIEVNQAYPKPLLETDAFIVKRPQPAMIGAPYFAFDGELQGVVLTALKQTMKDSLEDPQVPNDRDIVIPAIHLQKLLDEYRRADSPQKP